MEHESPQQMIDFDEDLVGDVSMRPIDALLASYGRHTKIPGERGGEQPARARTRNKLLFFTLTVDLLKGSRPTTTCTEYVNDAHGKREKVTVCTGIPRYRANL